MKNSDQLSQLVTTFERWRINRANSPSQSSVEGT